MTATVSLWTASGRAVFPRNARSSTRWAKTEVTPTTDLRKWFAHDPAKFDEFKARYIEQLDSRPEAARFADDVRNLLRDTNVTLLYAARDPRVNHVVILRDWLLERLT